jgi:hypothetical protein
LNPSAWRGTNTHITLAAMFLGGTKLPTRATKFLEMFRVFLFVGFPFGAATLAKDTDIMRSVILDVRVLYFHFFEIFFSVYFILNGFVVRFVILFLSADMWFTLPSATLTSRF